MHAVRQPGLLEHDGDLAAVRRRPRVEVDHRAASSDQRHLQRDRSARLTASADGALRARLHAQSAGVAIRARTANACDRRARTACRARSNRALPLGVSRRTRRRDTDRRARSLPCLAARGRCGRRAGFGAQGSAIGVHRARGRLVNDSAIATARRGALNIRRPLVAGHGERKTRPHRLIVQPDEGMAPVVELIDGAKRSLRVKQFTLTDSATSCRRSSAPSPRRRRADHAQSAPLVGRPRQRRVARGAQARQDHHRVEQPGIRRHAREVDGHRRRRWR